MRSLFARTAWIIVIGFVVLQGLGHLFYTHERMLAATESLASAMVDNGIAISRLLSDTRFTETNSLVQAFDIPTYQVTLADGPPAPPEREWPHADEIKHLALASLATKSSAAHRLYFPLAPRRRTDEGRREPHAPRLVLAIEQADGRWLTMTADAQAMRWGWDAPGTTFLALVLILGMLWIMRRTLAHVPRLAAAAEEMGRNIEAPPVDETGPREVRLAASAFNHMQARIRGYLEERSNMLGAVSHDLRTFLTRLELRVEHISDAEQHAKALTDIHDMTGMLDAALAFAREERHLEAFRSLDLASVLTSLVDEEHDLGKSAAYHGPTSLVVDGQPTALRRAFTNLIDNAIRYGNKADITLQPGTDEIRVSIADRGPGIPRAEHEEVLKPFSRLESSRNRTTGGTGLGLAVVDAVIKRHAGTLQFAEREGGGLVVEVNLPVAGNHQESER
jgi:signal transduction histidine kinase